MLPSVAGWCHILNVEGRVGCSQRQGPHPPFIHPRKYERPGPFLRLRYGEPEGRVDSHAHISGRTGWFGKTDKTGKIVIGVEKVEEEVDDGVGGGGRTIVEGEEKKMKGIVREMRIIPRRVEHFDW